MATVRQLSNKWDAASPVIDVPAAPAPRTGRPARAAAQAAARGPAYAVRLVQFGDLKIQAIKLVRELTRLGLKEAKDLVEKPLPVVVLRGLELAAAQQAVRRLAEARLVADLVEDA